MEKSVFGVENNRLVPSRMPLTEVGRRVGGLSLVYVDNLRHALRDPVETPLLAQPQDGAVEAAQLPQQVESIEAVSDLL